MKTTKEIIGKAFAKYRPALALSGGSDSLVLLDIASCMGFRPPLIYADSQMEYYDNLPFVQKLAKKYRLELHVAKAEITPQECWAKHGFPMLGKQSAREWMQRHRDAESLGFRLDVSTCCRKMKIKPARDLLKKLGCNANMTGQRGGPDDRLRGLRAIKDGSICFVKSDSLYVVNPLLGWTDLMISRYCRLHNLPKNPIKQQGALTIGCMYCGGGAQFDNSGFRVLRKTRPDAWKRMIAEYGFGEIILAIKYNIHVDYVRSAIDQLGGINKMIEEMPHVFDFLRTTPLRGYFRQ